MFRSIKTAILLTPLFLFLTAGATTVCAQPLGLGSPQLRPSQSKILSSENGRFVFGQVSNSSKDQFMLDTVTGRLWRIAETGRIGIFLKSVPYLNEKGERSVFPGKILDSAPDKSKK